ncbi:hypothetical protein F511_42458 [Dorcoceras hygrometricum]|uniref:Uncharacterized protein n=1 Tax=Dorcoceras hygrometricum TaxID=472368 RepID=A0A2Z7DDW2_9LAMI|nr:hypothetical protein F511_42458 [Dorcoceras hygrometricum]
MVVDLIGIYGLKGSYCTLTTTNWFMQALSVIPRGSWGDVARRSYHDPMGKSGIMIPEPQCRRPPFFSNLTPPPVHAAAAAAVRRTCSDQLFEENPSVLISSGLLVQADEGVSLPVVDLIDVIYRRLPDSMVSSTAASIDSASPRPEVREPWLPEPEELPTTPWYEEKSSNLKLSDIAIIKEKGGTMDKFEVVLPHPDERAHRPPPGFHTFYMNQKEMGLRFPIPRFIAALCHHIKISPSQLAPNSYRPGKFYISHKGDHTFIKGNPSSHKGWMSRFLYIKCDSMRDPWRCEMHWRDNVFILTPQTPDRAPSLTPFLEAMRDERMGRAELLRAMQEEERASGEVGPPKKATKKRKAPSSTEAEVHREMRKKSASSSGALLERPKSGVGHRHPRRRRPRKFPTLHRSSLFPRLRPRGGGQGDPPLLILQKIPW